MHDTTPNDDTNCTHMLYWRLSLCPQSCGLGWPRTLTNCLTAYMGLESRMVGGLEGLWRSGIPGLMWKYLAFYCVLDASIIGFYTTVRKIARRTSCIYFITVLVDLVHLEEELQSRHQKVCNLENAQERQAKMELYPHFTLRNSSFLTS